MRQSLDPHGLNGHRVTASSKEDTLQAPLGQTQQLLGAWSLGTVIFAVPLEYMDVCGGEGHWEADQS